MCGAWPWSRIRFGLAFSPFHACPPFQWIDLKTTLICVDSFFVRILIISQVYWPDTASTAQHLSDLALALADRGHDVTVFASHRAYENPKEVFPREERHEKVQVYRLAQTAFAKSSIMGRLINFSTFNAALFWRMLWAPAAAYDVVLGMTSPPLISFLGALVAGWKKWRFCYWAMDLQPELAIEAGLIRKDSLSAKILDAMGRFVVKHSDAVVALDRFMAVHLEGRGARAGAVHVRRVWPVLQGRWDGDRLMNPFRQRHGFGDKCVVMYSGNHAVVHPLATLLAAAQRLRDDQRFLFVFIGGGARVKDVSEAREKHSLSNVLQLPYQPREEIHISLASADLQVVIMGNGQVGYTHPNKVYGALAIGQPFLYIGPQPSHVSDIIEECPRNLAVSHGNVDGLVASLREFVVAGPSAWSSVGQNNAAWAAHHLQADDLISSMAASIESIRPCGGTEYVKLDT